MKEPSPAEIIKSPEIKEKWWMKHIPARSYENPETYIKRVAGDISAHGIVDIVVSKHKNKDELEKANWEEIEPLMFQEVEKLLTTTPERMPFENLRKEWEQFSGRIGSITNRVDGKGIQGNDHIEYFNKTNRVRDFYTQNPEERPLSEYLFNTSILSPEHRHVILKSYIDGKNIILLGGGNSVNDFIQSKDLHPKSVINIDPFITEEDIGKNKKENYKSISIRAESTELEKENIPKGHEIWATWSVPLYLEKTEDIEQLFKNIDSLLEVGGIARIHPISLMLFDFDDEIVHKNADPRKDREKAWINTIAKLINSKRYNLSIISGTMQLQKLAEAE